MTGVFSSGPQDEYSKSVSDAVDAVWEARTLHVRRMAIRALIAAVLADHDAQTRQDWQPIETAPRDGTWILASDGKSVEIVRWDSPYWEINHGGLFDAELFQPLPAPPAQKGTP